MTTYCYQKNKFCFICGLYLKRHKKVVINNGIRAKYLDYFDIEMPPSFGKFYPDVICQTCHEDISGLRMSLYKVYMIWSSCDNHPQDCYFCQFKLKRNQILITKYPLFKDTSFSIFSREDFPVTPMKSDINFSTNSYFYDQFFTEDPDKMFIYCSNISRLLDQLNLNWRQDLRIFYVDYTNFMLRVFLLHSRYLFKPILVGISQRQEVLSGSLNRFVELFQLVDNPYSYVLCGMRLASSLVHQLSLDRIILPKWLAEKDLYGKYFRKLYHRQKYYIGNSLEITWQKAKHGDLTPNEIRVIKNDPRFLAMLSPQLLAAMEVVKPLIDEIYSPEKTKQKLHELMMPFRDIFDPSCRKMKFLTRNNLSQQDETLLINDRYARNLFHDLRRITEYIANYQGKNLLSDYSLNLSKDRHRSY